MEITQFMNVISQLVFKACNVIKQVHESQNLEIKMKGEFNPVTMADMIIQTLIVKTLTKIWPQIQIVGEQSIQSTEIFEESIEHEIEEYSQFFEQHFSKSILQVQDFCIWIDPLDGTLSFTKGNLDDVTVMVGVSYKQKARIGVIGIPYERIQTTNQISFNPKIILSDSESQSVIEFNQDFSKLNKVSIPKIQSNRLVISRNLPFHHASLIRKISNQTIETYAMGNKFIHMVKKCAAGLIYLGKFASLWDTCAGQALIRSLGGVVTNLLGNDIVYDHSRNSFQLINGIVCAFDQTMYQKISNKIIYQN